MDTDLKTKLGELIGIRIDAELASLTELIAAHPFAALGVMFLLIGLSLGLVYAFYVAFRASGRRFARRNGCRPVLDKRVALGACLAAFVFPIVGSIPVLNVALAILWIAALAYVLRRDYDPRLSTFEAATFMFAAGPIGLLAFVSGVDGALE